MEKEKKTRVPVEQTEVLQACAQVVAFQLGGLMRTVTCPECCARAGRQFEATVTSVEWPCDQQVIVTDSAWDQDGVKPPGGMTTRSFAPKTPFPLAQTLPAPTTRSRLRERALLAYSNNGSLPAGASLAQTALTESFSETRMINGTGRLTDMSESQQS
jgi:hypothetical protein